MLCHEWQCHLRLYDKAEASDGVEGTKEENAQRSQHYCDQEAPPICQCSVLSVLIMG